LQCARTLCIRPFNTLLSPYQQHRFIAAFGACFQKDVIDLSLQFLLKPSSFLPGVQSVVLLPAARQCDVLASAASAFSGTKILGPRHTTVRRLEQRKVIRKVMEEGDIKPDNSSGELHELLTEGAAGLSCMVCMIC
jgi:hypothetical protein